MESNSEQIIELTEDLLFVLAGGLVGFFSTYFFTIRGEQRRREQAARDLVHKLSDVAQSILSTKRALVDMGLAEVDPDDRNLWGNMRQLLGVRERSVSLSSEEITLLTDAKASSLRDQILELFNADMILSDTIVEFNRLKAQSTHEFAKHTKFPADGSATGTLVLNSKDQPHLYAQVLIQNELAHQIHRKTEEALINLYSTFEKWNLVSHRNKRRWKGPHELAIDEKIAAELSL